MDIKIDLANISITELEAIINKLNPIGIDMASIKEVLDAVTAEQSLVKGALAGIEALIKEVRQLLSVGDASGADALLAEIQANSEALVAASIVNSEVAAAVDAVNGEPTV